MRTEEEESVWGMLGARGLQGGQGELTWHSQLKHCVSDGGHIRGETDVWKGIEKRPQTLEKESSSLMSKRTQREEAYG